MSAEMLTAISGLLVALVGAGGTVAVARAGRRTPRQEARDDFAAVTDSLQEQVTALKADVAEQKAEVAEQKAGRRQDSRTINALVRYLRKTARALRANDIPLPDPDPEDVLELQAHGLP